MVAKKTVNKIRFEKELPTLGNNSCSRLPGLLNDNFMVNTDKFMVRAGPEVSK